MTETPTAVVAGHICLDVLPQLSHITPELLPGIFTPGRLTEVGPAAFSTGGAVSNTGLALHKLGIETQLMGKIGDDIFGRAVLQLIAAHDPNLTRGMVVDPTASTSYTIVINPPDLDRSFLHYPGANDSFGDADIRYDRLASARLFHFGYPPLMARMYQDGGVELAALFRRAKETGVTTSLDMSLPDPASPAGRAPWRQIMERTLPWVDIFMPSIEELLFMLRCKTYAQWHTAFGGAGLLAHVTPALLSEIGAELVAMGARIVGLKLGQRGLYLRTAGLPALRGLGRGRPADVAAWAQRQLWAPCCRVDVAGTTGAGDATIAGFLSGLLRGLAPEAALTAAVAVGACNVEALDALSGIRPWQATLDRLAVGWPRHALHLTAPGWHFNPTVQLWVGPADARDA